MVAEACEKLPMQDTRGAGRTMMGAIGGLHREEPERRFQFLYFVTLKTIKETVK